MPDVTKQLSLPAGGNYQGIVATLKLVAAVDQDGTGYVSSTSVDIAGTSTAAPDNTGLITFTGVTANSLITPANTAYKLVVRFADKSTTTEWIDVPNGAGPYSVADILTTEPSDLPPAGAENAALGGDLSGTVGAASIVAGAVGATKLATDAVTTAKIQDDAVTTAKIAAGNVTATELATAAATRAKIADEAVDEDKVRPLIADQLTNQTARLTRWNAGLAVVDTERVDVLLPCDSMTQPWAEASGDVILSWLELVTQQARVFGAVTSDWRPAGRTFGATWTTTGAYSAAITHGFGAAGVTLDPGEYWEDTIGGEASNPGDAFAIYVTTQAASGASLQVLVDGVEAQAATSTTSASAPHGMHKLYESALLDGASHTIRVVASGSGTVKLDGMLVHHGTLSAGLVLWNGSLSGSSIQDHLDAGGFEDHATNLIAANTLALVVLASGLATYAYPGTATGAEWQTETQNALDMLDGISSLASVLIVCEYEPAGGFGVLSSNWQGWATTMVPIYRDLAETNGCAFVALPDKLPTVAGTALASNGVDYWSWGTTIDGDTFDYTHTNQRGQRQIADAIWPVLSQVPTHKQLATIDDVGAGGAGDVVGPGSATDSRVVTFDGSTGKLVQSEAAVVTDQTVTTSGGLILVKDGTAAHGAAALVTSVYGQGVSVLNDSTDTQPAGYLGGTTAGLRLGPGGSTPADVTIIRTGSAVATLTGELRTSTAPSTGTALANRTYVDAQVDDLSGVTNAATARANLGLGTLSEVTQAGRATLTAAPASGVARRLLQTPFDKPWRLFLPLTGATVTSLGSGAAASSSGTITTVAVANVAHALINIASAASAGTDAEIRQTTQPWYRGASSDTYGGAFYHARVRYPDASYNETGASTGSRINAGLTSAAPITGRRASSIHFVGFNREHENGHNTDTNWQFITNDGGATATTTDTGIAFAVSTVYDLWLWMPAGATTAYWQIDDVTNSTTASGSHTTDLPGATTALYPWTGLRTNDAVARTIQIARVYVEADKG